jgi:nucleotide-binding universal stress UspA family protein
MKKRQILVPIDGSDFSRQIFDHIREFFAPHEVELILLRVAEPPAGRVGGPPRPIAVDLSVELYASELDLEQAAHPIYASQERDSALAQIRQELQEDIVKLEAAGYAVRVEVRFGNPAKEIVDFVLLSDVSMVAITTHGRTGLGRLLVGSVAEHILRHVSVPILVLRPCEV